MPICLIMKSIIIILGIVFVFGCSQKGYKAPKDSGDSVSDQTPTTPTVPTGRENFLDLLLVIDDSGSMLKDNQKLAGYLENLAGELNTNDVDWQMCITTTDVEYYEGRTILWQGNESSATPNVIHADDNYSGVFTKTINWIGHGWSDDEQGIKAMNMAFQESANEDCFRDGAALSVILISDEDERSVGGNKSLDLSQFKELDEENSPFVLMGNIFQEFGAAKRVVVHSIIVTSNDCKKEQEEQGSVAFIGYKYKQLSDLTNGKTISICGDNYLTNLEYFSDRISPELNL